MSFGVIWIELLLTIVLLDFAARRLPTTAEQWLFYGTIVSLVIGAVMRIMHLIYAHQIILMSTFIQVLLFLLCFRNKAGRNILNYIILLWLLTSFAKNLFAAIHLHDRGSMQIANSFFFLIFTTWYFYLLVIKSRGKRPG
jgi:hypothetical protein